MNIYSSHRKELTELGITAASVGFKFGQPNTRSSSSGLAYLVSPVAASSTVEDTNAFGNKYSLLFLLINHLVYFCFW
jgi:hypothetical protein